MKHKILLVLVSLVLLFGMLGIQAQAATQTEINDAIQDGLAWLVTQQNADGSFGIGANPVAYTAVAVLAFENEGYFPGPDSSVPSPVGSYARRVEDGLDFIFNYAKMTAMSVQPAGNPDSDGDGIGVSFWDDIINREVYETGMVMQTIVASNTQDRVVTTGACSGWTYKEVMVDVVDWAAFAQVDAGSGRGGWRYFANYSNSDNSTAQWPVLGLVAAEQWGINAPEFVKNELNIWIDYIQNDVSGGSGYDNPNTYVNIAKTGGLLVEMYYVGDDNSTARAQAAIDFVDSRWNDTPHDVWYGNKGHSYAMFSVFKGLELMEVVNIPSAPANDETLAGDWWGDYCEYLVIAQAADGHWDAYYPSYWNSWLSTGWYIIILQATIFPVQVSIDVPDCACDDGYDVEVTYSVERFEAEAGSTLKLYENGDLKETVDIEGFKGTATHTYAVASDTPGMHNWDAELHVVVSGITAEAEDTDSLNVCETPDVGDIPDQTAPFGVFDLDAHLSYGGVLPVSWSVSGVPVDWTVEIDAENVVTVTAPEGTMDPAILTFTACVTCPCGVICSDSDDAIFVPNLPPDCSEAYADLGCLWPPNHKFVDISVMGVTDPDGDSVTITITAITSDEATATDEGSGGAKHAPDADGVGTDTASVRAERSGTGDGRVYMITFTASDGRGGECSGSVMVKVPHDQSTGDCSAIDSGQNYDATQIN